MPAELDTIAKRPASRGTLTVGRAAQVSVGLVLLVAGLSKVWDPVLVYWDAVSYLLALGVGAPIGPIAARASMLMGPMEASIGLALVLNWRPRVVFPAAATLLALFLSMLVVTWWNGYDEPCRCFGSLIERRPGEAMIEDAILLAALILGWWTQKRMAVFTGNGSGNTRIKGVFVLLVGLTLGLTVGGRYLPEAHRIEESDLREGVAVGDIRLAEKGLSKEDGQAVDLAVGDHLLLILTMSCLHCQESVPLMNALSKSEDLPSLVGVTDAAQNSSEYLDFKRAFRPAFPILTARRRDFLRLAWKHAFPRLGWVRQGRIEKVWESHELPTAQEITSAIVQGTGRP